MRKYFKHKIKSLIVVNKIVVIHYLEPKNGLVTDCEKHDFWEAVFVQKGECFCEADKNKIPLKEGEIIFHKPLESHSLNVPKGNDASIFVISFVCLSEAMGFFSGKKVKLNKRQVSFIKEIIYSAEKTYDITFYNSDSDIMNLLINPTLGGEQFIKNYLEIMLIDIMRTLTETEDGNDVFLQETQINNKLAEDVIKILKENIESSLSIEQVCKKISYSKSYLFKQFKLATGKSVMDYYLDLKIKHAKSLLKSGEISIKDLSEKLCFDTPNYFSKTFKKKTKLTPSQYKMQTK